MGTGLLTACDSRWVADGIVLRNPGPVARSPPARPLAWYVGRPGSYTSGLTLRVLLWRRVGDLPDHHSVLVLSRSVDLLTVMMLSCSYFLSVSSMVFTTF